MPNINQRKVLQQGIYEIEIFLEAQSAVRPVLMPTRRTDSDQALALLVEQHYDRIRHLPGIADGGTLTMLHEDWHRKDYSRSAITFSSLGSNSR